MKRKCKCPPDSPFHWKDNPRLSIFAKDPLFTAGAKLSQSQTQVVERERAKGKDISNLPGVSAKAREQRVISVKQFNIFARAGQHL